MMKQRHWVHFFLAALQAACLINAGIVFNQGRLSAYAVLVLMAAIASFFCSAQIIKNYLKDTQP
jgi:hypothetical protein